jgi:hypothetical protein
MRPHPVSFRPAAREPARSGLVRGFGQRAQPRGDEILLPAGFWTLAVLAVALLRLPGAAGCLGPRVGIQAASVKIGSVEIGCAKMAHGDEVTGRGTRGAGWCKRARVQECSGATVQCSMYEVGLGDTEFRIAGWVRGAYLVHSAKGHNRSDIAREERQRAVRTVLSDAGT